MDGGDQFACSLHAMVTLFAMGAEAQIMTATALDTRRRLNYADGQGQPLAAAASAAASQSECVVRRRESGIFYDAPSLVRPEQAARVGARLAELEQEVQAAAPIHAHFSSDHAFSMLLSSCVVVSVRLADDGVEVLDCGVDRRLVALLSTEKDKHGDSLHGAPTSSAGFLTSRFAVIAYGDGRMGIVRPRKATARLFELLPDGDAVAPIHMSTSIKIASAAKKVMVNADSDMVAALTASAVHLLALSPDLQLTPIRSVALVAEEHVLLTAWVPLKPRTLLVVARKTSSPSTLSTQTIFVAETAASGPANRRSAG